MKKMIQFAAGALIATASLTAAPSESGPVATLGVLGATGDALSLTGKVWGGLTLEGGYRFRSESLGVVLQPYLGYGRMAGDRQVEGRGIHNAAGKPQQQANSVWGPNTYDLIHWRGGFDIRVKPVDALPVVVAFGPSVHRWEARIVDQPITPVKDKGLKAGWRVGLSYAISEQVEVAATYTATEWTSRRNVSAWPGYVSDAVTPSFIQGLNPSKPNYLTLSATYRF